MTNPGGSAGLTPGPYGITGTGGAIPAKATQNQANVTSTLQNDFSSNQFSGLGGGLIAMILSFIVGAIGAILGGFASVLEAIFGTVDNAYISQIPIITDHSHTLTTLVAQFNQLILQGNAIVFTSNNTYTPMAGIKSIDVIIIGAGAGGAAGHSDAGISGNRSGGGGGGGGGEVHTNIPASLLPVDGSGNFLPITITVGAAGTGGVGSTSPGLGGGNTIFGSGGASLTAGGGNGGGVASGTAFAGAGGAGMIPGGAGGGGPLGGPGTLPGNSTSPYDLHGGGGGGGIGGAGGAIPVQQGGIGGISPGGIPGQPGTAPSVIVATGGGGGGGASSTAVNGGAGAYPAGGGAGGYGDLTVASNGGNGGNGILYVIERST